MCLPIITPRLAFGFDYSDSTYVLLLHTFFQWSHLSFTIWYLSFVICHLSFAICHLIFDICHFAPHPRTTATARQKTPNDAQ